jgi:hypothetical protein
MQGFPTNASTLSHARPPRLVTLDLNDLRAVFAEHLTVKNPLVLLRRMQNAVQEWLASLVLRAAFDGLVSAQQARTSSNRIEGVLPLPWLGPDGETVCVVLGANGRMLEPPTLCEDSRAMRQLMARHRRSRAA